MLIRDSIHGFINYNELEESIINTQVFQRLRNIRQLALASYVYPGAVHTRFDHSIGVMHLAAKIASSLNKEGGNPHFFDEEEMENIRLAGLLHDIGHGPLSHVSEQLLEKNTDDLKDLLTKYEADKAQELMSILIIQSNNEICSLLDSARREKIIKLLKKHPKGFLEKDIVSGPLDADKLDYCLRDTYFTGVKYGVFDIEKIIESMTPISISSTEERIGIRDEGVFALEQFLLANYHMKMQVYYHRVRRIVDAMVIRGVEYAVKEDKKEIKDLFTIKEDKKYLEEYTRYTDNLLIEKLSQGKEISSDYFQRLKERRLLKEIFCLELTKESLEADAVSYGKIKHITDAELYELSKSISDYLSKEFKVDVKPEYIIIDVQSFSNPTFKTPGIRIDANTIFVLNRQGKREQFTEVSDIFKNPAIEPEKSFLYGYATVDKKSKPEREELEKKVSSHVKEFLNKL